MTQAVAGPIQSGIDQQAAAERLGELITSSWISHAIRAGIDIGLFDAVCDGPADIEELARRLDCAPGALTQLVHACEALELCRVDDQGCCVATAMGRLLASRSEGSQQAWARLWCGDLAALWSGLDESIRHGASVRSLRGIPAGFGHLAADPARADAFNRAMTANTWWVAEAFALLPALQGCRHIVDVGGGHGVLMIALLRRHPSLRGTVFDLEHAAAGALQAIDAAGLADRAAFVTGDFFDHVPAGADTYVLKSVLHDWPDERCAAILACCRAAMSSGTRLFVVERLARLPLGPSASDRAWARSDLNMLLAHGARERTERDYYALLGQAGFRVVAVHGSAMGLAAIEVCTRP